MSIELRDTIDRALLLEVLAYIERHPENWNQDHWAVVHPTKKFKPDNVCGTSFCVAGHALVREGFVPYVPMDALGELQYDELGVEYFIPLEIAKQQAKAIKKGEDFYPPSYERIYAHTGAQRLLGLTSNQAERLFAGDNDLDALREIVAELLTLPDVSQKKYLADDRRRNGD